MSPPQIWELGISPEPVAPPRVDPPYAGNSISLDPPIKSLYNAGNQTFLAPPRGMAIAPDGSLYVADSRNHRVVHLDTSGNLLNTIGTYGNAWKTRACRVV